MHGFIVVDKPVGISSHDVVNRVRRICGQKKAGHTGTLDPFATGVLPVALGEGTKAIQFLDESVKEYEAVMLLGSVTDSQDCTGTIIQEREWRHLDATAVASVTAKFLGTVAQVPPMHSAIKHQGTPLYKLARRGVVIDRPSRDVDILSLTLERVDLPQVGFRVRCSRGTYVRTLAHDMGETLGCGAHLLSLRRIASGPFNLERAVSLEGLEQAVRSGGINDVLIPPAVGLTHLKEVPLTDKGVSAVRNGKVPTAEDLSEGGGNVRSGDKVMLTWEGRLAAVAECHEAAGKPPVFMRLLRVFNDLCLYTA